MESNFLHLGRRCIFTCFQPEQKTQEDVEFMVDEQHNVKKESGYIIVSDKRWS